jgi:glycosyltransferase involved in cell wall biosynthesis
MVTGFVNNPVPYFEKCTLAVVPLRLGAGIKVKVLECMEANMPVVSTTVGTEGIELRENVVVANDPLQFADAVIKILHEK